MNSTLETQTLIVPEAERIRLWECGPLAQHFPLHISEDSSFQGLTAHCAQCNRVVVDDLVHGEIVNVCKGVWKLKAIAYCRDCVMVSVFSYNFHSNFTVSGKDSAGNWTTWGPSKKLPWWKRILNVLFPTCQK